MWKKQVTVEDANQFSVEANQKKYRAVDFFFSFVSGFGMHVSVCRCHAPSVYRLRLTLLVSFLSLSISLFSSLFRDFIAE